MVGKQLGFFFFKRKLFVFKRHKQNLSHHKTVCSIQHFVRVSYGRGLSLGGSCLGLIYLEGKHSLGRLQSGCHQAFLMVHISVLVGRDFIISSHEKLRSVAAWFFNDIRNLS